MTVVHEPREEHVLCVPRSALNAAGTFEGASLDIDRYMRMVDEAELVYLPRSVAETLPAYKQLIPYIVLRTRSGRVLRYLRGSKSGETRLHGRYSIGIGGHISSTDNLDLTQLNYLDAMWREFREEVGNQVAVSDQQPVAIINDESNAVGQVHFGVVHLVTVENPEAIVGEAGHIANAEFVTLEELMTDLTTYENWSQICLRSLYDQLFEERNDYEQARFADAEHIETALANDHEDQAA